MLPLKGAPPIQTPEMNQVQFEATPERSSAGIGLKAKASLMIGGALSSAAILAPGAVAAETAPSADIEKAALAASSNNAITRSVDSFPAPEAQASAGGGKKGMQPTGVIKAIRGVLARAHSSSSYGLTINIRTAKLTSTTSLLKGKCNPRNPNKPYTKQEATRNGKYFAQYCYGGGNGGTKLITPNEYSSGLNWLGNRVATSAGVSAESRGSATKAIATSRRATLSFANDDTQAVDRQLKALILRKGKKPTKQWYPLQQATEIQP